MVKNWDSIERTMYQLYCVERRPLEDVAAKLKTSLNFDASPRAYKMKIKEWGWATNRRKQQGSSMVVVRKRQRRTETKNLEAEISTHSPVSCDSQNAGFIYGYFKCEMSHELCLVESLLRCLESPESFLWDCLGFYRRRDPEEKWQRTISWKAFEECTVPDIVVCWTKALVYDEGNPLCVDSKGTLLAHAVYKRYRETHNQIAEHVRSRYADMLKALVELSVKQGICEFPRSIAPPLDAKWWKKYRSLRHRNYTSSAVENVFNIEANRIPHWDPAAVEELLKPRASSDQEDLGDFLKMLLGWVAEDALTSAWTWCGSEWFSEHHLRFESLVKLINIFQDVQRMGLKVEPVWSGRLDTIFRNSNVAATDSADQLVLSSDLTSLEVEISGLYPQIDSCDIYN